MRTLRSLLALALGCDRPVEPSLEERRFAALRDEPAWSLPASRRDAFTEEYGFNAEGFGFTGPGRVVRTSANWAVVWDTLTARVSPKPAPPTVAFATEMAIVVFAGVGALGEITIDHVTRVRDTTFVLVVRQEPGRFCGTTQELRAPTAATVVPRATGPTQVVSVTRVSHCD